jgi:hypothetical protein
MAIEKNSGRATFAQARAVRETIIEMKNPEAAEKARKLRHILKKVVEMREAQLLAYSTMPGHPHSRAHFRRELNKFRAEEMQDSEL